MNPRHPCKRIGLIGVGLLALGPAQTSGQVVIFANNSASAVTNCNIGRIPTGGPFRAALYYGPDGSSSGSLTMVGALANFTSPGVFNGGTRTLTGIPLGATAVCQVRVWDSSVASTYAAAVAMDAMRGPRPLSASCLGPWPFLQG